MTVGMVAGDEESYIDFAELFDPVIDGRHNGYSKVDWPSVYIRLNINKNKLVIEFSVDP